VPVIPAAADAAVGLGDLSLPAAAENRMALSAW